MRLIILLMCIMLPIPVFAAPTLNFSDITSGPKTGNTDGAGGLSSSQHGAIVTVWGNDLGSSQGTSKIYFKDSAGTSREAAHIYYWGNADGSHSPANLSKYHKMQEVAFSIPSASADGIGEIYAVVGGAQTTNGTTGGTTGLSFTVRAGSIYFVGPSGNNANNGQFATPWQTLAYVGQGANGAISSGAIVYGIGNVSVTSGLNIGTADNDSLAGTADNPISLISYPGSTIALSGGSAYTLRNYYNRNSYWNFSKLSITTALTGINGFRGTRIIGCEITGPTVTDLGGGAIGGSGTTQNGGARIYGNYVHNYGDPAVYTANHQNTGQDQHLFYMSNRSGSVIEAYEIAWGLYENNPVGHGIHIYDQADCGGWSGIFRFHHNVISNQGGNSFNYNPNCTSGISTQIDFWSNLLLYDAGTAPPYPGSAMRVAPLGVNTSAITIANNTIIGYRDTNTLYPITGNVLNYSNNLMLSQGGTNVFFAGSPTTQSSNGFYSLAAPSWASEAITSNPSLDANYLPSSAYINQGVDTTSIVKTDFYAQPLIAGSINIGAVQSPQSGGDTTAPVISTFTLPSTATSTTVSISAFAATDNVSVTGYCVTTANSSSGCSWSGTAPTSVTFGSTGTQTAYAWARDAAGNINTTAATASVTISNPASISASAKIGAGGRINVGLGWIQ